MKRTGRQDVSTERQQKRTANESEHQRQMPEDRDNGNNTGPKQP